VHPLDRSCVIHRERHIVTLPPALAVSVFHSLLEKLVIALVSDQRISEASLSVSRDRLFYMKVSEGQLAVFKMVQELLQAAGTI